MQLRNGKLTGNFTNCLILGDGGIGKTTLTTYLKKGQFLKQYSQTKNSKKTFVNGINFIEQGKVEGFKVRDMGSVDVIVLMFDHTQRQSYKNVREWYIQAIEVYPNAKFIVVGNKTDIPPKVNSTQFSRNHRIPQVSISIKDSKGIFELYSMISN